MAELRQLELHLLRYLPFELKDDFLTVGLMLVEEEGRFADLRFTRDWRTILCVNPEIEIEWFEGVERELRSILKNTWRRENLSRFIEERIGRQLEMAPPKAVLTRDPAREIKVLAEMYFPAPHRAASGRLTGTAAIRNTMKDRLREAGVLDLMQQDLEVTRYTGMGDPFRIDFGYRVGGQLKMLHAVSLAGSGDQALALAFRYSRIRPGMAHEGLDASLTAVVEQGVKREEARIGFAIGMLQENEVRVREATEMAAIAEEVRRELRG